MYEHFLFRHVPSLLEPLVCGRFGRSSSREEIETYLDSMPRITEVDWSTTYNAAPGVPHPIVRVKPNGA